MFLDVQRTQGDTAAPAELTRRFADRFRTQQWPPDRPLPKVYFYPRSIEPQSAKRACLHAKCVVVDDEAVFGSSANFTEAAHERNIEMGPLLRSGRLAEQITRLFDALLEAKLLEHIL
jgi:phosphatidylserine/phosphatidylglycerophosphate/cardiolipin synthase-like enzyme